MPRLSGIVVVLLLAGNLVVSSVWGITANQVDDFEDGTVMGWSERANVGTSPNPPTNIPDGGPEGVGDHYLENLSSGLGLAGSRMVMFNTAQWTGDYLSASVPGITLDMANFGDNDLSMRIAVGKGMTQNFSATWYASAEAVNLPADGVWRSAFYEFSAPNLTGVQGTDTLDDVLADVNFFRILSSVAPDFRGEIIAATLGVDNITAMLLGDMDCDGDVDFDDIDDFVLGLTNEAGYVAIFNVPPSLKGDIDRDGDLDFDDISGFVSLLAGSANAPDHTVPEPSTIGLLGLGMIAMLRVWARHS